MARGALTVWKDKCLNGKRVLIDAHSHQNRCHPAGQHPTQKARAAQRPVSPPEPNAILPLWQLVPLHPVLSPSAEREKLQFDRTTGKCEDANMLFTIQKICLLN